jgi:hypothetical protein
MADEVWRPEETSKRAMKADTRMQPKTTPKAKADTRMHPKPAPKAKTANGSTGARGRS